jgi:hypothetical protein
VILFYQLAILYPLNDAGFAHYTANRMGLTVLEELRMLHDTIARSIRLDLRDNKNHNGFFLVAIQYAYNPDLKEHSG